MNKEIKTWWEQAKRDLQSAKNSLNSGDYYVAAFMAQQSAEKGLKVLYIKKHREVWKIHDLVRLAREINAPSQILSRCASLTPAYFETRYPDSEKTPAEKVNRQEAEEMIKLAEEILTWIETKL